MTTDVKVEPVSTGTVVEPVTPPVKPGEKTDPALLLESLKDEREKRRTAEDALKKLQDELASGEGSSEEGRALKSQIAVLEGEIALMKQTAALGELYNQFPALKDKAAEFETYRSDPVNKGMSVSTAAKAFLAENNLMNPPPRKGVEKPSGGGRTAPKPTMTLADINEMRTNDFRKYSKLLKEGAFNGITE